MCQEFGSQEFQAEFLCQVQFKGIAAIHEHLRSARTPLYILHTITGDHIK